MSGEAGAWKSGSVSQATQGWLHHPPAQGAPGVLWASANSHWAKAWPVDCTEAISFILTLSERLCPSATPSGAEQGTEDPSGPTSGSWGTVMSRIGPGVRHFPQCDSVSWLRKHSCLLGTPCTREQAVPVMQAVVQESLEHATAFVPLETALLPAVPEA